MGTRNGHARAFAILGASQVEMQRCGRHELNEPDLQRATGPRDREPVRLA